MKHSKLFLLTALLLAALLAFTACGAQPPTEETLPVTEAVPETTAPAEVKTRTVLESLTTEVFVGDMTITSSTVHSYDERGLLKEIVGSSNGEEYSRTVVENDEHGEVIRQTATSGENAIVTESQLTYDESGNLIHRVDTVSENGTATDIREYTYNPDHTLAGTLFTRLSEPAYTIANSYEYDDAGRKILEIQTHSAGTITHIETLYDENGRVTGTVVKNDAGEVTQYGETIYEDNGTVKQVTYFPDGTPSPSYTLTTYNEQGNPLTQETWNGDTLAMRMTYTYITVPAFK